jgi:hypothetical protein
MEGGMGKINLDNFDEVSKGKNSGPCCPKRPRIPQDQVVIRFIAKTPIAKSQKSS